MNKDILSLKRLYQFLFVKDYPIFSNGIISKGNKVGLTLTKFWQENILIDFRNSKYGRMVWRVEGGRNRYISEFCNRSSRISFYNEYACEWSNMITQEVMLRQCNQFSSFLVERSYNYDVFAQKLDAYIRLLSVKDSAFSKGAENFFEKALLERSYLEEFGVKGQSFFCGWMLSFLMLHAMAGNGEGELFLRQLRKNQELSIRNMAKSLVKLGESPKKEAMLLTTNNSEICREPLDGRHFFGREEELFELRDMLKVGGKYLISGIGGIGKTELMRQLFCSTIEEGLADTVCVIQYEGNMADSLIRSFRQMHNGDKEIKVQEALAIIRMHADEKVVIFIDNVTHSVEEDADIELLLKLQATVFMTSRYSVMKGFETYVVKPISKNAGALIFRDNYALPITRTDKQILSELLEKDIWCHTLTLRLLGKVAKAKNWTLQEMLAQVDAKGKELGLGRQVGYNNLKQLYRQMYSVSAIEEHMNHFLQVFAMLPYGGYSMEFIKTYLKDFLRKNADVEQSIEMLWKSGWLEKREDCYSMHPFVAECVLVNEMLMVEVTPFFDKVIEMLKLESNNCFLDTMRLIYFGMKDIDSILDDEKNTLLLISKVVQKLPRITEERYFQLVLLSFLIENCLIGKSEKIGKRLEEMRKQAEGGSESTYISILIALHQHGHVNLKHLEKEYDRVIRMNLPSEWKDVYKITLGDLLTEPCEDNFRKRVGQDNCSEENCIPVRISGMQLLSQYFLDSGDIETAVRYQQEGVELVKNSIYENCHGRQLLEINLASLYSSLGKYDEAEALVREWNIEEMDSILDKWSVLMVIGSLKRNKGESGFGVDEFEKAMKLAEVLFVDCYQSNYFKSLSELALAYHKAERYEEAILFYQKSLMCLDKSEIDKLNEQRILNNLGVLCLELDKYEEAKQYLIEAYELGRKMGGLPQAEPANNLSKLWRKIGDREKERQYIKEALPVLEHFYGPEHPKVVDAKNRME